MIKKTYIRITVRQLMYKAQLLFNKHKKKSHRKVGFEEHAFKKELISSSPVSIWEIAQG